MMSWEDDCLFCEVLGAPPPPKRASPYKPPVRIIDHINAQEAQFPDVWMVKFGRLTPRWLVERFGQSFIWECDCECGEVVYCTAEELPYRDDDECCERQRRIAEEKQRLHNKWLLKLSKYDPLVNGKCIQQEAAAMKRRCIRKVTQKYRRHPVYPIYRKMVKENPGHVYPPWLERPDAFIHYMGKRPGRHARLLLIDPERPFEPGNLRWTEKRIRTPKRKKRLKDVRSRLFLECVELARMMES